MYCTDPEVVKARKKHRCTWCGQAINTGETYQRWVSFDDSACTNKMHPECLSACNDECGMYGDNEYTLFEGERPLPEPSPAASGFPLTSEPDEKSGAVDKQEDA